MAEREGFEPTVVFSYSRFPGVRLKPLSHLSNHCAHNVYNECLKRNVFPNVQSPAGTGHTGLSRSLRNVKTRHLHRVPHQQPPVSHCRMVPGLALKRSELRQLQSPFRYRFDQGQLSISAQDDQVAAGQQQLPVTIPSVFPFAFARLRVEARQNVFIQTVNAALPINRAREFVFQPLVLPDRARRKP